MNVESELNSHLFWVGISYQGLDLVLCVSHRDGEFIRMVLVCRSVITVTVSWSLKLFPGKIISKLRVLVSDF